jgi:hypothetical protein
MGFRNEERKKSAPPAKQAVRMMRRAAGREIGAAGSDGDCCADGSGGAGGDDCCSDDSGDAGSGDAAVPDAGGV